MGHDKSMPNRAANKSQAEGEQWSSDSDTVERRDREMGRSSERVTSRACTARMCTNLSLCRATTA
jgi:hypothetical protein